MKIVSPISCTNPMRAGFASTWRAATAVSAAYDEMMNALANKLPQAQLEGVLVEKMAPKGMEVIVGMRRDPSFGPLIMFGLGGIYVELFADVAFRIAPVSREEALEMILETTRGEITDRVSRPARGGFGAVSCVYPEYRQVWLWKISPKLRKPK